MVTGLRAIAADEGHVMAADRLGKLKTVCQGVAIVPLMLHFPWFGWDVRLFGEIFLYVALTLTVLSGTHYFYAFYKDWRVDNRPGAGRRPTQEPGPDAGH
jgi:CDP-diacylglycerol--glycerol-3-phosphate 3-phosphatidyltransferase